MKLFERMMEPCTAIRRTWQADGEGGRTVTLSSAREFMGAITHTSKGQGEVAGAMAPHAEYALTTRKGEAPDYYQVFRQESCGRMFRVITAPADLRTPGVASFQFEQVGCEPWDGGRDGH